MRPPDPTLFRAFGYLSIAFATVLFFLFVLNLRARLLFHGPDYSALLWMSMYWGSIGVGLAYLRKWAVGLFVISTVTIGLFLIAGSILKVQFPWALANIATGVLFCFPCVPAARCWTQFR
jgi:hypothetical protein